MFQKSMSVPIGQNPNSKLIFGTLSNSFSAMEKLGDDIIRPFLQDVIMFFPLLKTLTLAAKQDLLTPLKIVPHVGVLAMGDFVYHMIALALYTFLANYISPILIIIADSGIIDKKSTYQARRLVESWKFGSGLDYYDHE